jgi:hypothetical protein
VNDTEMTRYITDTFADVETTEAMGYTFFFYDSDHKMPFATLAAADNEYDRVSNLDRPDVYRLNIGVGKDTYRSMLGKPPAAPGPGGIVETGHDFTALDRIMPHPHYAPQSWVCVLSPGDETLRTVKTLLAEAYEIAERRNKRRKGKEQT